MLCLLIPVFISACSGGGGGGGGSSNSDDPDPDVPVVPDDPDDPDDPIDPIDPTLQEQSITFDSAETQYLVVGEQVSRSATGEGTGAISYISDADAIASVSDDGTIEALAIGEATITASIAADETYDGASISLTVEVVSNEFILTGWIGSDDSIVDISAGVEGVGFYRSSDESCDFSDHESCNDGQLTTIDNSSVTDSAARLDQIGHYLFEYGNNNTTTTFGGSKFSPRKGHQALTYDGKLWVIGGESDETTQQPGTDGRKNDVWSSSDGITWLEVTDSASFSARHGHASFVFGGLMWVIGGTDGNSLDAKKDIWYSSDGENWTEALEEIPNPVAYHKVVVLDDTAYLFGGRYGNSNTNEVFSSTNGTTWDLLTAIEIDNQDTEYKLEGHQMLEFGGKIWIIGGSSGNASDVVLSSENGSDWEKVESNDPDDVRFSARFGHQAFVQGGKIWVVGGRDYNLNPLSDIWYSDNGSDWQEVTVTSEHFTPRFEHKMTVLDDRMWLMGGDDSVDDNIHNKDDIWYSDDGETWALATAGASFSARSNHQVIEYEDNLLLIGGEDDSGPTNDVWSSDDGADWQFIAEADFPARKGHQVINYNDEKLVLIGGEDNEGNLLNDIWYSDDGGQTWEEETIVSAEIFPARKGHQALVFAGDIYVIGGEDSNGDYDREVWISDNGDTTNWREETTNITERFSARTDHQAVVVGSEILVIGGLGDSGDLDDVWSSVDGIEWSIRSSFPGDTRRDHQVLVDDGGKLWIIGGRQDSVRMNDTLYSDDAGENWTIVQSNGSTIFSERYHHQSVIFDDKLLIIGGFDGDHKNDVWWFNDDDNVWRMLHRKSINF